VTSPRLREGPRREESPHRSEGFLLEPTGSFESAFRFDELFVKVAITGFRYSGFRFGFGVGRFRFGFVSIQVWPTKPIIGRSAASLTTLEFFHRGSYSVIKGRLLGSGPRPPLRWGEERSLLLPTAFVKSFRGFLL